MSRRSSRCAVLVVLAATLLSGCLGGEDDGTDASLAGRALPECGDTGCAEETKGYAADVRGLSGVDSLEVTYREEQITAGASIIGDVTVTPGATCDQLEDDLGRLLWESAINPVSSVSLQCYLPGASGSDYDDTGFSFLLKDADELADRWGPRGG